MNIACGVDLVYLPRFKKSLKMGGENFIRRVYLEQELKRLRNHPRGVPQATRQTGQPRLTAAQHHLGGEEGEIEHLAGIFAAKEAVMKALDLPIDSWHEIKVIKNSKGSPSIQLTTYNLQLITYSLSISHDGDYCVAQFIAILKK